MTKVFAEIYVLKPKDAGKVVETLIKNDCAVVIRANAHDQAGRTIFVHAYGNSDIPHLRDNNKWAPDISAEEQAAHRTLFDYFEKMLDPVGGDVMEYGEGHEDTTGEVVPPVGLQFAIDVFDDVSGVMRRISCAEYSPERAFKIAIEAAGVLASSRAMSNGNALARRLLLAALGGNVGKYCEGDDEPHELLMKREATA